MERYYEGKLPEYPEVLSVSHKSPLNEALRWRRILSRLELGCACYHAGLAPFNLECDCLHTARMFCAKVGALQRADLTGLMQTLNLYPITGAELLGLLNGLVPVVRELSLQHDLYGNDLRRWPPPLAPYGPPQGRYGAPQPVCYGALLHPIPEPLASKESVAQLKNWLGEKIQPPRFFELVDGYRERLIAEGISTPAQVNDDPLAALFLGLALEDKMPLYVADSENRFSYRILPEALTRGGPAFLVWPSVRNGRLALAPSLFAAGSSEARLEGQILVADRQIFDVIFKGLKKERSKAEDYARILIQKALEADKKWVRKDLVAAIKKRCPDWTEPEIAELLRPPVWPDAWATGGRRGRTAYYMDEG
jgi:hypothetical protein